MNTAELDRLWKSTARKIVSVQLTGGPGPPPGGPPDQTQRVIATPDDGGQIELVSFDAHERSFAPEEFVGSTVDEARRLKGAS
jgi:hypothetical protein